MWLLIGIASDSKAISASIQKVWLPYQKSIQTDRQAWANSVDPDQMLGSMVQFIVCLTADPGVVSLNPSSAT